MAIAKPSWPFEPTVCKAVQDKSWGWFFKEVKVSPETKSKDLSIDQENAIRKLIEEMTIEGNLKREVAGNIKRLKDIKAYRGVRHMRNLPVRGQRTKTNSRTRRGNVRKTMGTGRKIAEKK